MTDPKDQKKLITGFALKFNIRTEGLSYFIIVPLLLFYTWSNLNFTGEQLDLFLKLVIIIAVASFSITQINNFIAIRPIVRYFNRILRGEEYGDEEYQKAHRRLLYLPLIHSIGAFFRWIVALIGVTIPMQILGSTSPQQDFSMWMMIVINAPLGAVLYY